MADCGQSARACGLGFPVGSWHWLSIAADRSKKKMMVSSAFRVRSFRAIAKNCSRRREEAEASLSFPPRYLGGYEDF
jgi:hypothetical protein